MRTRPDVAEVRRFVASDRGAVIAFRVALGISAIVFWVVGRHQWFIRDDFAFLITRNLIRVDHGIDEWLFVAQDGHWMTPPILVYRAIQNLFGIDSYWPFLIPTMADPRRHRPLRAGAVPADGCLGVDDDIDLRRAARVRVRLGEHRLRHPDHVQPVAARVPRPPAPRRPRRTGRST